MLARDGLLDASGSPPLAALCGRLLDRIVVALGGRLAGGLLRLPAPPMSLPPLTAQEREPPQQRLDLGGAAIVAYRFGESGGTVSSQPPPGAVPA